MIQLREKLSTSNEFYHDAQAALAVARDFNVRLIINDRVDIALALKAHGVHLGQSDIPVETARRLLGENAIIGLSTHNLEQIEIARQLPVDYIALGPVFETATKGNPDPVVGLEALQQARAILNHIPLVAIGGITIENARAIFAAGADAVALIGALVRDPAQIEENTRRFLNCA